MNTGDTARLWNLETSANALVQGNKRDPVPLLDFLQRFVYGNDLGETVWREIYKLLDMEAECGEFFKANCAKEDPNLWSVPVLKGVTCNKVVAGLKKAGGQMYLYANDLDKEVTQNDRDPNRDGSYVVGFKRNVEADEDNANKSANQLKEQNHKGITLLERLLLELAYFLATSKHLDEKNWTLCSGSRCQDGSVPGVVWYPGGRKVSVYWYRSGSAHDGLRSRSAVS